MGPLRVDHRPGASGAQGCGRIGGKGIAGPGEGSGSHEEEARNDAAASFPQRRRRRRTSSVQRLLDGSEGDG